MGISVMESTKTAYKLTCMSFGKESSKYIKDHVKITGIGKFETNAVDIEIPFTYLSEIIHRAAIIYDGSDCSSLSKDDKDFMSGIKYIDNTI